MNNGKLLGSSRTTFSTKYNADSPFYNFRLKKTKSCDDAKFVITGGMIIVIETDLVPTALKLFMSTGVHIAVALAGHHYIYFFSIAWKHFAVCSKYFVIMYT